uniref:Serine/threonine-protein phosphatase 2A 55 kDa regulatory subunit B n=1 Tax=Cyprinus carpio TaxID=7962 RepID=A0A8C1SX60_CYPCA
MSQFLLMNDNRVPSGDMTNNLWIKDDCVVAVVIVTTDSDLFIGLVFSQVPVLRPMDLMVEATPRRVFSNAHTYHINSISVNSDYETFMSTDDLRINLWNLEITNRSFNIVDIKPVNMEELTEVITAAEFHPHQCNTFVYSSSKGSIRLCDMRASALCDNHSKFFEEPEDPSNRSFFSEIISSISDVKFSHSGRYLMTRDYLTVKVWDLNMESKPLETYQVHDYLRSKLCSLYENDCIFDKFECTLPGILTRTSSLWQPPITFTYSRIRSTSTTAPPPHVPEKREREEQNAAA